MDLPRGTITYLFTDVQGSSRLWEQAPELMTTALEVRDRIIDQAAVENAGVSVKPRGETFLAWPRPLTTVEDCHPEIS